MNFWKVIEENLWNEGFDVLNENESIQWDSEKGSHTIELKNIAINGDKIAWYQDEEYGRCWVKIKYPNGIILNWQPLSNHSDFGFSFHYIKWFQNKLIVIYTENKSGVTDIIEIEKLRINEIYSGNITDINIEKDNIYLRENENFIKIIHLNTELTKINEISNNKFIESFSGVELKSFQYYFLPNLDSEYNKNYS